MTQDICWLSATDIAEGIRNKTFSSQEVVRMHLDRIEALNPTLNAIVTFAQDPMEKAKGADAAIARGDELGAIHGVPFTLKDCVEVAGLRATQGSLILKDNISAQDSTVYKRLKGAGGILLGKTNLPEFALWWETNNRLFGATHNPWKIGYTPGGSSGGEGASLATGMSPLGVGTDLGGSIRQPSSFCGLAGLKPTLGRVPYTRVVPQTLFRAIHVGPMARNVQDVALGLSIMAGPDGEDIYAPPVPVPDYTNLDGGGKLRIGWSPTGGTAVEEEVQKVVADAAEALSGLGHDVERVEIPGLGTNDAQVISSVVYLSEAKPFLLETVAGRESEMTPLLRKRYIDSPEKTLDEYLKASFDWESLKWEVGEYFRGYDLFLCPTAPMPAYEAGREEFVIDGKTMGARHSLRATVPWDLTGSPAMNVPFGWSSEGMPIGVQLVARHFDEHLLLKAAKGLEGCQTDRRRPAIASPQ